MYGSALGSLVEPGVPLYRTPDVYLELEATKALVARGVRTGVPAFLGFASAAANQGDHDETRRPRLLTRWEQFGAVIGSGISEGFLEQAVHGFFSNGGTCCVVVPIPVGVEQSGGLTWQALMAPLIRGGVLEEVGCVDLVCVPDIVSPALGLANREIERCQRELLRHCARMGNRFALLDAFPARPTEASEGRHAIDEHCEREVSHWQALGPQGQSPEESADFIENAISDYGALYFPWVCVERLPEDGVESKVSSMVDSTRVRRDSVRGRSGLGVVPPCGHVAGIIARVDQSVGVQGAPANALIEGALDLELLLSNSDQARLNDIGVNCLRSLPGRGIRLWGARTLSRSPQWQYVSVRRLFLTLVRWFEQELCDFVFEPHSPRLWEDVRERLNSFCYRLYQGGALQGSEASEAYFVKCDREINTPDTVEQGQLIAVIGLAPVVPGEFVVVRMCRRPDGVTMAEA